MSYLVLARKWRPMRFEDLVGQDHVTRTLGNAIKSDRVAHAFLFTGVRGVGKTTSARILAKALNCMGDPSVTEPGATQGPTVTPCLKCPACVEIALGTDMDVREIDGASYNGVDEVRKLQDSIPYRPTRDRYKIFIVDEVHMLSQNAWNAFLKTLEEPPPHVKFIFATTEVHKVPITILSRVQRFDFKLISASSIADRLRHVLIAERIEADDAAVSIISREAAGSMRDAMSLLDQVIAWGGGKLVGEDVARVLGVARREVLYELSRALLKGEPARCLEVVADLADEGHDMTHVARDFLSVLRDLTVAKLCPDPSRVLDLPLEEAREAQALAEGADTDDLLRLYQGFSQGFDEIARGEQPRAALEMLLLRQARRPPLIPIDILLQRVGQLEKRLSGGARERPPGPPSGGPLRGAATSAPTPPPESVPRPRESRSAPAPRADVSDERNEPPPSESSLAEPPRSASPRSEPRRLEPPPSESPRWDSSRSESPSRPPARSQPPLAAPRSDGDSMRPRSNAAPRPGEPASRDLEQLFRAVVARVAGTRPELAAKLEHGVLLEAGAGRLLIGWAPGSLFGALVATPENTLLIEQAASAVLEVPTRITNETESQRAVGKKTLSGLEAEARDQRTREAYDKAKQHPRIAEAVEVLGARLKDLRLARPT